MEAALANGVYIPSLCYLEGVKPAGSCRVCNVKVNGRFMTACTTPVAEGMVVENNAADIEEMRSKPEFVRVSTAGMRESHVHDVQITKEAPNYRV